MSVRINLLGVPSIEVNGIRQDFSLKKTEALLYYLAKEGSVPREKLASLLWGDKDEESANNNLRNALYFLRGRMPKGFIKSDRRTVSLGAFECDLNKLDGADLGYLSVSHELLKDFELPNCQEFGEWLDYSRTEIKNIIFELLKNKISLYYDAEDRDSLTSAMELLLKIEPFDEDSVLELMEIYFSCGSITKGRSVFLDYKAKLSRELNLAPSKRAEELFNKMLVSYSGQEKSSDTPESYFFGREYEQSKVISNIAKNDPKNIVFLIDGEPGIGKTSFVNRLISVISSETGPVFSTMSYEAGHDYPYSAWNSLVAKLGSMCSEKNFAEAEGHIPVLSGVFPNFMANTRLSYNADFMKMAEVTPDVIAQSIVQLILLTSSGKRPVITAEDLQWFDSQSLHLLEAYLTMDIAPSIVFITTRPEKREYALSMLRRLENSGALRFTDIHLCPFDEAETSSLCRKFLDSKQLEQRENDYVFKESEGLPLLVVELIRALRENAEMEHIRGGLGGLILARFGEIPESHREFMRILSVFTNGAEVSTIRNIMNIDEDFVGTIAEELLQKQLIKETENIDGSTSVDFMHSKVRECVYKTIPGFKKREYNKKAAEALSKFYSPHTWNPALSSMICYHYTNADLPQKVMQQHLREMIFEIILNHDLFPLVGDEVLLSCKLPFSSSADTEKKMNEMRSLLDTINRRFDSDRDVYQMEATYLELRGACLISIGEYREGRVFINNSLQIAREHGFHETYIHCLQHMGHEYLQTDNGDALLRCAREMLVLARREKREIFVGLALRFIGVAFQIKGDFAKSDAVLARSAEVFEDLALVNRPYTISLLGAKCYIGENHQWRGDFAKAREIFEQCIAECERGGFFWGCSHFHAQMANLAFDMNDTELMNRHIKIGAELFEKCRGGICGSALYSLKCIADAREGRYHDALRSIEISELISSIKKKSWRSVHLMAKAYLAEMKDKGILPKEFDSVVVKSSEEYAKEAAAMCRDIGNLHRFHAIEKRFGISL